MPGSTKYELDIEVYTDMSGEWGEEPGGAPTSYN